MTMKPVVRGSRMPGPSDPIVQPTSANAVTGTIEVAVRVRPYNKLLTHEAKNMEAGVPSIVEMEGDSVFVQDKNGKDRKFEYDHAYWSHDGFKLDNKGRQVADGNTKYADQDRVFDDIGQKVLDNAMRGYDCSIFAYGQTGSGKSYSIFGPHDDPGIVPRVCSELFQRGQEGLQVEMSFLEVYNETICAQPRPRPRPATCRPARSRLCARFRRRLLTRARSRAHSLAHARSLATRSCAQTI